MDKKGRELVNSLKQICRHHKLKVFEPVAGRCKKHDAALERSGKHWLCWDCQLELAAYSTGGTRDLGSCRISVEGARSLFGPSYWKR